MIWPWLMGFSALVVVLSSAAQDRWAVKSGALILMAFIGTRVIMSLFAGNQFSLAAQAALWLMVAVAIPRQDGRKVAQVKGLIAASSGCYVFARAWGIEPAIGAIPYVVSDLLVIAAMVIIGWRGLAFIHGGIRDLVRNRLGRIVADNRGPVRYLSGAKK